MKTLEKICKVLDTIASAVTVALLVFLTILITYSVISRFIFNTPVAWQYEATLVCLSWVVFIGMSVTFRNDEHMRLTFVSNAMPTQYQTIPVSRGLFYMPFPIGCCLSVFHIVNTNLKRLNGQDVNVDDTTEKAD